MRKLVLTRDWLKAFLPIGSVGDDRTWRPMGAGVLFSEPPVVWIVTAAHVVRGCEQGERVAVLVGRADGGVSVVDLTRSYAASGIDWCFDSQRDIAAGLLPRSPNHDIKALNRNECLSIAEVLPSTQCYTVGCPYAVMGFDPLRAATPLVLDGIVAGVNEPELEVYITTPTFPGNSGGPVILVRPAYSPDGRSLVARKPLLFAGIVKAYRLVPRPPSVPDPELPPLHLGVAVAADAVLQLIDSPGARSLFRFARDSSE